MNNLDILRAYIKKQAPPEGIEGDDDSQGKFRDLKQYYEKKVSGWDKSGTDTEKRRARDLVNDPLEVCGLTPGGKELCQPDTSKKPALAAKQRDANKFPLAKKFPDVYCPTDTSKKLAVAANLLAMSIVQNIDNQTLWNEKVILERLSITELEASLKIILTKGDLVKSTRIPNLELKNFGSLNQRRTQYIAAAENAFQRARDLLSMSTNLLGSSTHIPERFKQTFKDYFGDPNAKVDVVNLGFQGGAPIVVAMFYLSLGSIIGNQTRWTLVRAVLNCVWKGIEMKTVRLYFGGGTIIPNVKAYTTPLPEKVRNQGRINVHLGLDFFTVHGEQAIKGAVSSRAGVLIHEFTHALAGTIDAGQAFSHHQCKRLAKFDSALTNAQSYACFVEDALG